MDEAFFIGVILGGFISSIWWYAQGKWQRVALEALYEHAMELWDRDCNAEPSQEVLDKLKAAGLDWRKQGGENGEIVRVAYPGRSGIRPKRSLPTQGHRRSVSYSVVGQ
jgi:hypothetical protein